MTQKPGVSLASIIKVLVLAALLSVAAVGTFIWYGQREPTVGGNFSLTSRGQPWNSVDHLGKLNILYIGYAKCPDVCPLTLSVAGQAFQKLSAKQADDVHLFFLSVDREHDKPDDVANYAAQFFPSFVGLSGSQEQIDQTVALYHAMYVYEKDPKSYLGYSISHSDRLFFLDKRGHLVAMLAGPRSADIILQTIKENL